jgi:TP901 family phage tail tape measure protein
VAEGGVLPPAVQVFVADAEQWVAGIDEMIEANERLLASIDEVIARSAEMDGAGAGAGAAAGATGAGAGIDDAASQEMIEQQHRIAEAAEESNRMMDDQIASLDRLAEAQDATTAAVEATTAAVDEQSAAMGRGVARNTEEGDSAAAAGRKGKLAFFAVAAAMAYSVVKATKFQAAITQLNTQAGVSKSKLASLGQGVLALAGQVGEDPDSLAESLYHVESNFSSMGISSSKALGLVKVAAEGARVGGADLVDVTNALTAAVASGIPGVSNMSQAMGALNATVGAGDMKMQDLADAFGTGMVAAVKGYGLSLKDVGAALDVFGDNNIRGAKAGTDLRMAVQALAVPVATAAPLLAKLGMNTQTLAKTMQHGGLLPALKELKSRMEAAGYSAKQQGNVITQIFGKKAGVGLAVLLDQMDRLKSKYPALEKGAHAFGSAWQTTQKTTAQQFANLKSGSEAAAISLGEFLLPVVLKIVGGLNKLFQAIDKSPLLQKLAGVAIVLAGALGVLTAASTALDAAMDANPIMLIVLAVIALVVAVIYAYKHVKAFRDAVADVGHFFEAVWHAAMVGAAAVIHWFVTGPLAFIKQEIAQFKQWWAKNGAEVKEVWHAMWTVIKDIGTVYIMGIVDDAKAFLKVFEIAFKTAWSIISMGVKYFWGLISTIVRNGITIIEDVVAVFLDLLTGHWSKAWNDLKKLAADALHGAIAVIKQIVVGFPMLLFNAGRALIGGLINGIKSMIGSLASTVSGVAHKIAGFFGLSPAIEGPLSGQGAPEVRGRHFAEDLARGIASGHDTVGAAARALAANVSGLGSAGYGGGLYGPTTGVRPGAGALAGGGAPINIRVELNAAGSAQWQLGLQKQIQTAVLDYALRNQGSGLIFPTRNH